MSAVAAPLLIPCQTDIIDCPENTRLRKISRCEGREKSAMPAWRQLSRMSSRTSVSSVLSPAVSTTISSGRPSGSSRIPFLSRLARPISSSSAFAALRSKRAHAERSAGSNSGLAGSTVLFDGCTSPKNTTWLISWRLIASESARRKRTSRISARQAGSSTLRLG